MRKQFFNAAQFVGGQFDTAADKARFANQFVRLVQGNFSRKNFPKWFYQQLSHCRGHIAEYDQNGFFNEWFSQPHRKVQFIERWVNHDHPVGNPAFTFSDVEQALVQWLIDNDWFAKQTQIMHKEIEDQSVKQEAEKQRLAPLANQPSQQFRVVAISDNVGAFGMRQHIMVAADGTAYKVHRSVGAFNQWEQGQIIDVPLEHILQPDGSRLPSPSWGRLSCEMPMRLEDAPTEVVTQVWPKAA